MGPSKKLDFLATWTHPLDQAVNFVRLSTGFADLGDDDVTVDVLVDFGVALDPDETMFLGVVEPVSCASCADDALQLVCLDPDDFLDALVTPDGQTLTTKLHCASCHPQEDQAFLLQQVDTQRLHFAVFQSPVRQRHVDVPRRVRHYHVEVPQHAEVDVTQVAVYPLRRQVLPVARVVQIVEVERLYYAAAVHVSTAVIVAILLARTVASLLRAQAIAVSAVSGTAHRVAVADETRL